MPDGAQTLPTTSDKPGRRLYVPGKGRYFLGKCWDIADQNIARFKVSRDKALRGEGTANVEICEEKIDQWLEYRHSHGPDDEAWL